MAQHEGNAKGLQAAMVQAYKNATETGDKPPFVVDVIVLEGTNPLTNYKVKIHPTN